MTCAPLIMFPFPSLGLDRVVSLFSVLRLAHQDNIIVWLRDPTSAQTVIFIPRARPCSEIPFSLQRHPTACTSRLQEKVDLLSSQVGVQASVALTVCPLTNSSLLLFLT